MSDHISKTVRAIYSAEKLPEKSRKFLTAVSDFKDSSIVVEVPIRRQR